MTAASSDARTLASVLRRISAQLDRAGVASPRADAEQLLAHVLGVGRADLLTHPPIDGEALSEVDHLADRRAAREPLQHITGQAHFRHLTLQVGPGVFVPRPETEIVVDAGLGTLPDSGPLTVVDLCSGSGAIALSIATERPDTHVYAVELDTFALAWLRRNVVAHGDALRRAGSRISIIHGDAGAVARGDQPLATLTGSLPLVITNPPYVPDAARPRDPEVWHHDPGFALYGGADGLDVVRRLADSAADLLAPGGAFIVEHSDDQGPQSAAGGVPDLLARHEDVARSGAVWNRISDHRDLAGRPRYTVARRAGP